MKTSQKFVRLWEIESRKRTPPSGRPTTRCTKHRHKGDKENKETKETYHGGGAERIFG